MSSGRNREEKILAAVIQLATMAERAAYLKGACGNDDQLRQRVEALFKAREQIETSPATFAAHAYTAPTVRATLTEKPGDRIGRYKLLQQIGEGGCGIVYLAEQEEPVRRRVALKVIKLGMDTRQVIARFEAERQALALMDHPNIAKVLDAGATDTGRPYFVMELVNGIRITDYCDQQNLSMRERLDLFVQVCHTIQHAHQKGIIHRDIKPSNILVSLHDDLPMPKVIDFGIAKATAGQRLTDKTLFTALEQFIGTPAYMSPEQAEMSGLDIDTRSDIYSLGVLLYELLVGKTPFDAKQLLEAGLDEMRRTIREKEPARPSTRVSTMAAAERMSVGKHRQSDASKLIHIFRGDLDWIVMKSLEKDRTRRYETANGLAMDIHRHLNHEPVLAAAPSAFYRFQKFARRWKTALIVAFALAGLLITGAVVSTWQAVRASRAEQRALIEASRSRQVAKFLEEMLDGVRPAVALGRDKTLLKEILDKAADRVSKELRGQPEVETELRHAIGQVYFELAEYSKAEAMFRAELATNKLMHGSDHGAVAKALTGFAAVLYAQGKSAEAEAMQQEALAVQKRLLGPIHTTVAESLNNLSAMLYAQGKLTEAEQTLREALAIEKKLLGNEHLSVAKTLTGFSALLATQGKLVEAESRQREALTIQRKLLGNDHPAVALSLNNLAVVLDIQGKLAEAESMHREALVMRKKVLGQEHPDVSQSLNNLAAVFQEQGKLADAEIMQREALAIQKKLLGNEHREVAGSLNNLAAVLEAQGKLPEAETMHREALAMRRKTLGNDHPHVADSLRGLASVLRDQRKLAEAEPLARECLAAREKNSFDDWQKFDAQILLAGVLLAQNHHSEAELLLVSGYEGLKQRDNKIPVEVKQRLKEAAQGLVRLYETLGRSDQVAEWKKKLEAFEKATAEKKSAPKPKGPEK